MVNYNNGKIYSIRSHKTDLIYIGSTVQTLHVRLSQHKSKYKKFIKSLSKKYCTSYEIFKLDNNPYIELICNYACDSLDELNKKEGEIIKKNKCINKQIAGRDRKQYYKDNEKKIKEYVKKYNELNKEAMKEKKKKNYE